MTDQLVVSTESAQTENPFDNDILKKCFAYVDEAESSPRKNWLLNTVAECINFVELRQWISNDVQKLALIGVPTLAIDRITRSIDTLTGIRENTGGKKKIVKRELGDNRVATMLDETSNYVGYQGGFKEVKDEAFKSLLYSGIGIRKVGFDPYANNGEGEIWAEKVEIEDFAWSRCKRKDLTDITWCYESQIVAWEEAVSIIPEKAEVLYGLRKTQNDNWDKIKGSSSTGTMAGKDYQNYIDKPADVTYDYHEQIKLWNFWCKKVVPYKKVISMKLGVSPYGEIIKVPEVRAEQYNYQLKEGEQLQSMATETFWVHYVIGGEKSQGILLATEHAKDHPYVIECADRKKSGMPFGFIEKIVPHQKRINVAWAQKQAYNVKSIKAPLVAEEGAFDLQTALHTTSFGSVLFRKKGKQIDSINMPLGTNLQAIEEGQAARADMDNITAVGEPVLSGSAGTSTSGLQLSMQQNAAITPINKWIQAENASEIIFWRKVLQLEIEHFTPQKFARILGLRKFMQLISPIFDQMTGEMIEPPVQFPLDAQTVQYDVIIEDQALSDFNKQMTFNAAMELQSAIPNGAFDDEFLIKNAPLKNMDDALASNQRHKNDVMRAMMGQIQMLTEQVKNLVKLVPRENRPMDGSDVGEPPIQRGSNAQIGRNAPQSGIRSSLGGQNGLRVLQPN